MYFMFCPPLTLVVDGGLSALTFFNPQVGMVNVMQGLAAR